MKRFVQTEVLKSSFTQVLTLRVSVCVFVCGIMFEREMRPHRVSESPAAGETAQVLFILFLVLRVWISVSY